MNQSNEQSDDGWDRGWAEHERRQRARMAELSFPEKLEWLEQAQEFGEFLREQGRRARNDQSPK